MSDRATSGSAGGGFLVTKEYRRFAEFCDACRRYRYIGVCHGPPGVGKTLSARHYARWEQLEPVLSALWAAEGRARPPELADCRSVLYTPTVTNTPREVAMRLSGWRGALNAVMASLAPDDPGEPAGDAIDYTIDYTELILIDEADRLKMAAIEQVRDSYDRLGFGLVLIGMPGLEKRLARYPQLYSRVGFVHQFRPLSSEELRFILQHQWQHLGLTLSPDDFTDAEALAAIARITSGNFRVLHRLFAQIERILQINELRVVTKEVVEAARESLVIGAV
jgi:DNA transposition AAA+ family ATPase